MRQSLVIGLVLIFSLLTSCMKYGFVMDEVERSDMTFAGYDRYWLMHVPANLDATKKVPLVFVLHGITSRAKAIAAFSGFNELADEKGFIVCYPQGVGRSWGVDIPAGKAARKEIDDVAFVDTMLALLMQKYPIASDSIYSCGISNGGFMSVKLTCDRPGKFAGIAMVCSNMFNPSESFCPSPEPTRVLIFGATKDPFLDYTGGGEKERFPTLGYPGTAEFWLAENGLSKQYDSTLVDELPSDKTRVIERKFEKSGSEPVWWYEVQGGGHGWPGREKVFKENFFGDVTREIDASREIIAFFLGR